MTASQLENSLEKELVAYIKKEGHVASGKLIKSIRFQVTVSNFDVDIKLKTKDYIQYLDNGNLLDKFLDQRKVKDIIASFYVTLIEDIL